MWDSNPILRHYITTSTKKLTVPDILGDLSTDKSYRQVVMLLCYISQAMQAKYYHNGSLHFLPRIVSYSCYNDCYRYTEIWIIVSPPWHKCIINYKLHYSFRGVHEPDLMKSNWCIMSQKKLLLFYLNGWILWRNYHFQTLLLIVRRLCCKWIRYQLWKSHNSCETMFVNHITITWLFSGCSHSNQASRYH